MLCDSVTKNSKSKNKKILKVIMQEKSLEIKIKKDLKIITLKL